MKIEFIPKTAVIASDSLGEAVGTMSSPSLVSGKSSIAISNIINLSLEPVSWLVSYSQSTFSEMHAELNSYIATDLLDSIPEVDLEEELSQYEDQHRVSSEDFYQGWLSGEVPDTPEANDWMSLLVQLRQQNSG